MAGIEDPHLGGAYECGDGNTRMEDVWTYLIEKYDIRSVVDIGCGYGHNARWFLDRKFHVTGIEGDSVPLNKNLIPLENLIPHDYTTGPLTVPHHDLAWCSEFVEHVEERYIPNFIATMKCCRWVCMTHGEPGQDGFHHVNCQPTTYWTRKLLDYGLVLDAVETSYLRSTDTYKAGWGRRTLMWLENIDHPQFAA